MFGANMSEVVIERHTKKYYLLIPYFWLLTTLTSVTFLQYGKSQESDSIAGNKFNQCIFGSLMILGGVIIFNRWKELRRGIASNIPLIMLLGYSFLSISWSDYKFVSFRRFVLFLGGYEMIFIIYSGENKYKDFFDVLYYYFITVSVLSVIVIIIMPAIGTMKELGGAWKGITSHKNNLGQFAAVGCLLWVFFMTSHLFNKKRWICTVFLILDLILLFKSKSTTGLFTFSFVLGFYFLLLLFRTQKQRIPLFLISLGIIIFCMVQIIEQLLLSTTIYEKIIFSAGKDLTFTARTYIWGQIFSNISKHPVWGCGFGGFWLGMDGASEHICRRIHFILYQAHNGYIDLLNDLGIVGCIIFIILVVSTFISTIKLSKQSYFIFVFFISLIMIILMSNTMETSIMRVNHLYWFLFATVQLMPFPRKC